MNGPFPDKFLRRIAPDTRKKMGKAALLSEEAIAKFEVRRERELQEQMEAYLRRNDYFYLRMPMHRAVRDVPKGWPDFTIFLPGGRALLVEVKTPVGEVSEDQKDLHYEYEAKTGGKVLVVRSLADFQNIMARCYLPEPSLAGMS